MKRPPVLMRVQIQGRDKRFGLWLPLFMLLPLAVVLLIILSPLILIACVVFRLRARSRRPAHAVDAALSVLCSGRAMKAAFDVLCSARGLRATVINRNERVNISII